MSMESTNKKHLMIATPAYSGQVNIQFALALSDTALHLAELGIQLSTRLLRGGALLVADRNRIIEEFWRSDCTHLLCIDADLGWPVQAVSAMLAQDLDFVAGVYPARMEDTYYFIPDLTEYTKLIFKEHLIKAKYIPAGFILISRECVAKLRDKFSHLYYEPKREDKKDEGAHLLFNTEIHDGEFWGEDFVFCRRVAEAGIDIWVDPLIEFDHNGKRGQLIDFIKSESEKYKEAKL